MPEFLELLPPQEALQVLLSALNAEPVGEALESAEASGRVTLTPIVAHHPLPSFERSTVDGYAVRARDTFGASESLPAYLAVAGEVPMGGAPQFEVGAAQCALIHTGGMLPAGTDAVIMVEHTQEARPGEIEILRSVAVGENVLKVGEDVAEGQEVIPAGIRLRAPEIGGLMALGVTEVTVAKKPCVGIISSGDEVVSPEVEIKPGQVRDVNAYTLSALVESAGGTPVRYGIVTDEMAAMREITARALQACDLVVITAGSSASTRDLTSRVIDDLGQPGVLVHGVNVRPGKPTILAVCDGKAIIGLPGNPVSALVIASLFVVPVIEAHLGLRSKGPRPFVPARLAVNLSSQAGREDWIPVRLVQQAGEAIAEPIFGKSNLIFTLARADGLIRIPPDATGLPAGESIHVMLF